MAHILSGIANLPDAAMPCLPFARPLLAGLALAATLCLPLPARADDGGLATDDAGDVSLSAAEAELDNPERAGYQRLMRLTRALDQAAGRKPGDQPTALLAARALATYGGMSGQRRAHELVEEVLRQDAKSIDALLLRSRLDWGSGCLPCAERDIHTARRIAPADARVLALLKSGVPALLIANKLDTVHRRSEIAPWLQSMQQRHPFAEFVPMSAKNAKDIERLFGICEKYLPEQPWAYGEDELTDRSERFLASEIVREKLFRFTGDELPYTSTVVIDKFEDEFGRNKSRLARIAATIVVERDSHKAMVLSLIHI